MTDLEGESLSPLQRALLAVKELRARLEASERAHREPIAVIGMSCRFPGGANSPAAFWELLRQGVDAIGPIPAERWDGEALYDGDLLAPGKMNTRHGGFLKHVDLFDAAFFGLSPREAAHMDPQQRLLLEVAYEALEAAGQSLEQLAGSRTGVFVGVHSHSSDYTLMQVDDLSAIDMHTSTGTAHSIFANRLSYLFDFNGPSIALDTACSSSLVAVHLACQSLRSGESDLALVGGANLILRPEITVSLSKMQALSPDGRCKTFDADADGFGRGEGCGVVVLKRLSDALEARDPILAVIAGSAVNQDGATNGLTAPNGLAQQAVIRQALANAGVEPSQIGYVETHGTGTVLGDPIEVEALAAVLGQPRADGGTCVLGAVKTNIGHLEGAAGIAGLIKVVLSLQHQAIPRNLHFKTLNPHISLADTPFVVPTAEQPWPAGAPRYGAVSSFGFGGANAHIIVASAPPDAPAAPQSATAVPTSTGNPPFLLTLSARSEPALHDLAAAYQQLLLLPEQGESSRPSLADICYTATRRRTHHPHRLALVAASAAGMAQRLEAFRRGESHEDVSASATLPALASNRGLVFVFSGQGATLDGMAQELLATEPIFRARVAECDELLQPYSGWSLLTELTAAPEHSRLAENEVAQPAIFAVQVALAALWQSWGVQPDAVVGHSVGEVAAATVAGILSLPDAVRVIYHRGRVMQKAAGSGRMAATGLSQGEAEALLATYEGRLSLAAVNSPMSTVLSGDAEALQEVVLALQTQGRFARILPAVNYASHSHLMQPYRRDLEQSLAGLQPRPGRAGIPIYSTVDAAAATGREPEATFDAAYWGRNLRQPVLFAPAVAALVADGYRAFLEVGPHPLLATPLAQCLEEVEDTLLLASLRQDRPARETLQRATAALHCGGYPIDWSAVTPGGKCVTLPVYPWQHARYWVQPARAASFATPEDLPVAMNNSLPLRRLRTPVPTFEAALSTDALPYLGEHLIYGAPLLPAAMLATMVWAASGSANSLTLSDVSIQEALPVPSGMEAKRVQLLLMPAERETTRFQLFSLPDDSGVDWILHATGNVSPTTASLAAEPLRLPEIKERCREVDVTSYYQQMAARGLQLGPSFQGVKQLWRGDGEALGRLQRTHSDADVAGAVHPTFLDACLQPLTAILPGDENYLLIGMEQLHVASGSAAAWSHARLHSLNGADGETVVGEVNLYDEAGRPVGRAGGVLLKRVSRAAVGRLTQASTLDNWLYDVEWREQSLAATGSFATPDELAAETWSQMSAPEARHDIDRYRAILPELESLTLHYVHAALRQLGCQLPADPPAGAVELARQCGVIERYHPWFAHFLDQLAKGDTAGAHAAFSENDPAARLDELMQLYPDFQAELALIGRCGAALAAVLRGGVDPLELLFPDGSLHHLQQIYASSPFSRPANTLLQKAISAAIAGRPAGSPVRILEIGAGVGGATGAILPHLPAERTEYTFTDVSPLFLARAKEKFRDISFMRYEQFDLASNPGEQAIGTQHFDLVIAANVVHATPDLRQALGHIRQLLAPNGLFLLLEVTQPALWIDLTFGLTDGWWNFADKDLRPAHPLLYAGAWLDLLSECGFTASASMPAPTAESSPQTIFIAGGQPPAVADESGGLWLIFGEEDALSAALAKLLAERGQESVLVQSGDAYHRLGGCKLRMDPQRPEHFERLLADVASDGRPLQGVLYLWAADIAIHEETTPGELSGAQQQVIGGAVHLIQALAARLQGRLWLVTRGAQVIGEGQPPAAAQATLWGLGRVMALEYPEQWGGLIDLDMAPQAEEAARLLAEMGQPEEEAEDQIAWRAARRYVARLVRSDEEAIDRPQPSTPPAGPQSPGTVLITGGLGGLGLKVAHWLAAQGVRHLVLTGRNTLPPRDAWPALPPASEAARRASAVQAIEAIGASVTTVAIDVADEAQMAALFERFGKAPAGAPPSDDALPPLRGVIHAAAAVHSTPLAKMTLDDVRDMFHAKVAGTWTLHRLTRELDLDYFVLFSSTTALWGVRGMAHYAAANCFLDAVAHARRIRGLPALSINWGLWEERSRLSTEEQLQATRFGLDPMPVAGALAWLGALLDHETVAAQKVVAAVDWAALKPAYEARRRRPFLAEIDIGERRTAHLSAPPDRDQQPALLQQLPALAPDEQRDLLLEYIRRQTASVMGHDHTQLDVQRGLFEIGMDSLMAVELRSRLESAAGRRLPAALIFNYPSVKALAGYLETLLLDAEATSSAAADASPDGDETDGLSRLETASEAELLALFDEELGAIDAMDL